MTAFAILAMFFISDLFPGHFDTSGFMIRLSVPEIEGGTLSVTEKEKKDWSWGFLGSGCSKLVFSKNDMQLLTGLPDYHVAKRRSV